MAMTTGPSKYAMKMNYIYIAVCIGCTLWLVKDGYFNPDFVEKHTKEDGTHSYEVPFNKVYGPIGCIAGALWFGYASLALSRKKLTVDENGLTFESGTLIPLDSLTKIDKSKLKTRGKLLIDYEENGETKTLKLRDAIYDDIDGVLEEILKLTGKGDKQEHESEGSALDDKPTNETKDSEQ